MKDLQLALKLGWRLAGGSPQQAATSDLSRMVSPGPVRNTDNKLAPTRSKRKSKQNRLGDKALIEEHPCLLLRGVNSMVKPNGRLVLVSYAHHCASTSSLSTRSSSWALQGDLILGRASRLYAFSGYHNRTSLPSRALGRTTGTQEVRPSRSSRTKDSPRKSPTPTADRDRTVSRRSEPSSRTALIGEQPNPWNLLQLQDAMSRHRGAKPMRRYELLALISLLSPAYLLSVERWPFHTEPPDH